MLAESLFPSPPVLKSMDINCYYSLNYYQLTYFNLQAEDLKSLSDIDDLSTTFWKVRLLNYDILFLNA